MPTTLMVLCFLGFIANLLLTFVYSSDFELISELTEFSDASFATSNTFSSISSISSSLSQLLFGIYIYKFNTTMNRLAIAYPQDVIVDDE